jgi:methylmalonyl-CoA/ethylmalonyl-CoA epimerase
LFRLSPHHVGIIVAELSPAMDSWHKNLGVSFWVFEVNETNSRFSGSGPAFKVRFGFGLMGVSAIELIQPVEGETIYSEYLRGRGPGLHHLGFLVTDLAASGRQLESAGCQLVLEGSISGLGDLSYYRAQDGHCIIEPLRLSTELPLFLAKHTRSYP